MAEERVQRRLAAIMAADVVGYSRLIEADEERTRARIGVLHFELIDPRIAADGGRIVKTMGDGILVEFPSAVDAVRNALSIQNLMRQRNLGISEDIRIVFRIGVNVGDVIIEGDDIHGDGVNVAARLEGICEPGQVYVSGTVYDQADGKLEAKFEELGEQTVKNIAKPVRVYRASDENKKAISQERQATAASPGAPNTPSVAVLPFDNLSNDPEQDYFSDGMAEDLITDISQISGLFVTARNSSFAFKGQTVDVKEIAKQLGVKHIVEGSVRKMGDRLRINAQLIDAASGGHLWAQRYDGDMAEIFDFQDDIREQIVSALQVNLTPSDKELTERKPTENVEAYDLFLKGRACFYRFTPEAVLEAKKLLEDAVTIDPNFADAYSYLSLCLFWGWSQLHDDFDDNLDRAYEIAEKAVELDGTSTNAVMGLAWIKAWSHQYDDAFAIFDKALASAPNNAGITAMYGQVMNFWGDPKKGLEMIERSFKQETFPPPNWELWAGHSYFLLRQYDQALPKFALMVARAPKFAFVHVLLACAYAELDRLDDARKSIQTVLEVSPRFTLKEAAKFFPYRLDDDQNRILDGLRKAGLPEG